MALLILLLVISTYHIKKALSNGTYIKRITDKDIQFDQTLPISNGSYSQKELNWAITYLRLPVWSAGYKPCTSPDSEVSCFEVVRAAKAIKEYETSKKNGVIFADVSKVPFQDKMSMIYHAFAIAMATNRKVLVDYNFVPNAIPPVIENTNTPPEGVELPTDYQFGCASLEPLNLLLKNVTWPQAVYTHHEIAPFLRKHFSYHAAYFIGNYLFGFTDAPSVACLSIHKRVTEVWRFKDSSQFIGFREQGAGFDTDTELMTNDQDQIEGRWQDFEVSKMFTPSETQMICSLKMMIAAEVFQFTFGSRLGFWANAMRGKGGSYTNPFDDVKIVLANSQCGSLWHTQAPNNHTELFRTNNRLFVCGPNINDVRLYIEYLLW